MRPSRTLGCSPERHRPEPTVVPLLLPLVRRGARKGGAGRGADGPLKCDTACEAVRGEGLGIGGYAKCYAVSGGGSGCGARVGREPPAATSALAAAMQCAWVPPCFLQQLAKAIIRVLFVTVEVEATIKPHNGGQLEAGASTRPVLP